MVASNDGAHRVNTLKQDTSDCHDEDIEATVGNDESSMGYYVAPIDVQRNTNRNNIQIGAGGKTTTEVNTLVSSRMPIPSDAAPFTNRPYINAKENRLEFRN